MENAIIVDIDWTLAKHVARWPYEMDKLETYEVIEPIRVIIGNLLHEYRVVLMSGRSEEYRAKTERWLEKNKVGYHNLLMRTTWDSRPDTEIKKELYNKYLKNKYNVVFAIDDRNRIVDQWRNMGIFTLDVNQTREDF